MQSKVVCHRYVIMKGEKSPSLQVRGGRVVNQYSKWNWCLIKLFIGRNRIICRIIGSNFSCLLTPVNNIDID